MGRQHSAPSAVRIGRTMGGLQCFEREPPPDPTIVPRQALEKIRLLVESKLDQDHEAVLRVESQHQKNFVVDVLDTFITELRYAELKGKLTRVKVVDAMFSLKEKMKMTEHDLVILGHDVHQTQLAGDLGIAARAFEIQVLLYRVRRELLRDLPCFWWKGSKPPEIADSKHELSLEGLHKNLRTQAFNTFDESRNGILDLDQTVHAMEVLEKMPKNHSEWQTDYKIHFLDKHFGTTEGRMERRQFEMVWKMCQDGVMSGAYRLWALGISPYDVLEPCSTFLSGSALAYLYSLFQRFDWQEPSRMVLNDVVIEAIAMAAHPKVSDSAVNKLQIFKRGENGGSASLWKLDNNGDGRVVATEWVLFFVRVSGGYEERLKELCHDLRLHDVRTIMDLKRRGHLRDRYIEVFDALDVDGDGSLQLEEVVKLVEKSRGAALFDEVQVGELARMQLNAMDKNADGEVSLSEWLRWIQARGDLDEMSARNYHHFNEMFGDLVSS